MADVNKSISISINILNNAKADLASVSSSVKQVTQSVTEQTAVLQSHSSSWKDVAKGVFAGEAAYSAFKEGVSMATDFLKSSVEESIKAQAEMALVKTNVENAGFSYAKIGPQIEEYSKKMIKMGFDDEATATSVSKLLLITHNYSESLKINQLAMDLARSKNVSLEQATSSLSAVLAGAGGKALQQYGIYMKDGATTTEILTQLQDKLKGASVAYAETTAGKLATLNEEWKNMQQKVGDDLTPTLIKLFNDFEQFLPSIELLFQGVVTVVDTLVDKFHFIAEAAEQYLSILKDGLTTEERAGNEATAKMTETFQKLADAYNKAHTGAKVTADDLQTNNKLLKESAKDYTDQEKAATATASAITVQDLATDEQTKTVDELGKAYDDVSSKVNKFTFDSQAGFQRFGSVISDTKSKNADYINDAKAGFAALSTEINKTKTTIDGLDTKITDAKKAFSDFVLSTTQSSGRSFAQIVNDANLAIPDLQKQIAEGQKNGNDVTDLQKQLADKQSIINSAQQTRYQSDKAFTDELTFLQQENNKNELDKAYDLMNQKIADKKKETDNTIAQLELEKTVQTSLHDQYVTEEADMTAVFKANLTLRIEIAKKEKTSNAELQATVDSLTKSYNNLAQAIIQANAVKGGLVTAGGLNTLKGYASGGAVSSGTPIIVGEQGPEVFVPSSAGSIIPNNKMANGGNVTVNINNPTVRNNNDLNSIITAVTRALGRQQELSQYGSYI